MFSFNFLTQSRNILPTERNFSPHLPLSTAKKETLRTSRTSRETKESIAILAIISLLFSGCYRSITVTRAEEWELTYRSVGLKTDVSKIEAERTTNGTVRVLVKGVATDVSERNAPIVEASGTAIGNVAEKVIEGMK